MKTNLKIIFTSLFIYGATFAQKDELKLAEKAIKAGNPAEAKTTLATLESTITNADNSQKAQYFFLKGNASFELAKKKIDTDKNLLEAAKAYNDLLGNEKESGKNKYSVQADASLKEVRNELFQAALADDKEKKYKESALKLHEVYQLGKNDTIMLYYAAGNALNAQDFDLALNYYNKLKDLNFSGKGTNFLAKNKATDKDDTFNTLKERDFAVKIGTHTNPKTENITSKRGEIYKYIAQIYIHKGDVAAAKKSIVDARKLNPDDTSLLLAEADLYLKTDDFDTYKKLITEATEKNPNDADLFFNLGVIASKSKEGQAEAEKNYLKAIAINPNYKNAYMNLAVLKLEGEGKLVEQMNAITGTSAADNKKYDALKLKRQNLFKSALPYLEKAQQLFADDEAIKSTLLNVYNALDMTDKYKALKAKK